MDNRVVISADELTRALLIWLIVLGQRRPALLRNLWTRRGEEHDAAKIEHARRELARHLAEKLIGSGWEVTRNADSLDRYRASGEWNGTGGNR